MVLAVSDLLWAPLLDVVCQLLFVPGLLEIRGRPCEGLPEATPSLRGLGRGSWEQKATMAMKREGAERTPWREELTDDSRKLQLCYVAEMGSKGLL